MRFGLWFNTKIPEQQIKLHQSSDHLVLAFSRKVATYICARSSTDDDNADDYDDVPEREATCRNLSFTRPFLLMYNNRHVVDALGSCCSQQTPLQNDCTHKSATTARTRASYDTRRELRRLHTLTASHAG